MSDALEKLAGSLTADSIELIPFLPYLLSDLWELGSSPEDMISLISNNICMSTDIRVIDLACGKGAVSISIAEKFGCRIKGVDIMSDFIITAKEKAKEYKVSELCEFVTKDINQSVIEEKNYDIVIYGATGYLLGDNESTLNKLYNVARVGGYVLIDDAYKKAGSDIAYLTKEEWVDIIDKCGFLLVDDLIADPDRLNTVLEEQMRCIKSRVDELKIRHPDKASIFDGYIKSQLAECRQLETDLEGVTMLLKKQI